MPEYSLDELRVIFCRDANRVLIDPEIDKIKDIPKKKRTCSQKRRLKELKEIRRNGNRHIEEGLENLPSNHAFQS